MDALPTFLPIGRRNRPSADEQDVYGAGRRVICKLVNHHSAVTSTKNRARRRDRRADNQAVRSLRYS